MTDILHRDAVHVRPSASVHPLSEVTIDRLKKRLIVCCAVVGRSVDKAAGRGDRYFYDIRYGLAALDPFLPLDYNSD